ncbi:hypothetical protein BT69DRAFT_938231 [Atractiella rhizophila]|nr:hypothetical protein BT69DRAFT_938231 [Atractiella rhizophila]
MALSCSLSPPTSYLPIPSLSTINAGFWYLLGSRTTPPPVIVKTTWLAREELENEIGMFKAARGKFGLGQLKAFNVAPIYETNWIVPDRYMNFEHLQGYTMNDCAWRAGEVDYRFQSMLNGETRIPSSKLFSQMFFDWEGRRLETAKGPKELFVAMGHALVGHAIAYQHNWLHCDISLTNILIAVSRRKDLEVDFDTEDEHLLKLLSMQKNCRGILIDGNKALRLDSEERYTGAAVNCWVRCSHLDINHISLSGVVNSEEP